MPPKNESVLCAWPCLACLEKGTITLYLINEDKDFRGTITGTMARKRNHTLWVAKEGWEKTLAVELCLRQDPASLLISASQPPQTSGLQSGNPVSCLKLVLTKNLWKILLLFPTENFPSIIYGKHKSQWESNRIKQGWNHSSRCCTQLFFA